ncbi:MAG: aspartate--tRNA(Asn) ligase [Thermoplasmata archaeon]|nr:aspartate--tRNA(Asn) ligase [Thermoplasmata archaeon]
MMRTHYTNQLKDLENGTYVTICGWIQEIRNIGNIAFIIVRDREGIAQVTLLKNDHGDEEFQKIVSLSRESTICVKGKINKNTKSKLGVEIYPEKIDILSIAEAPLPMGVVDKVSVDIETRLNERFMDLRRPEVLSLFKVESSLGKSIRRTLEEDGFLEVHTPKIIATATEGGTNLFKVKYFEKDAYLVQSPQLYKQIMMAAGFDRVYEIAPAFRAEEHNTTRHLNEFISIDIEMSFATHEDAMSLLEKVITNAIEFVIKNNKDDMNRLNLNWKIPERPFPRVTYSELLDYVNKNGVEMKFGEDFSSEALELIGKKYKEFYFITRWPMETRAFYVMPCEDDPIFGKAFDLQYGEREITSGAQRNHNYNSLKENIEKKGLDPKSFEFYLEAFKYGMPPHAGWAIGLERLTMILTGVKNIREVTLFPRDRKRVVP